MGSAAAPYGVSCFYELLAFFVQAPFHPASTGNVEENKTVEGGQLAFVNCRKEVGSNLELPMELEISDGHRAAAEKRRLTRFKPQHHCQPAQEFDDSAEPELGPRRWSEFGEHPQNFLGTVEREHESRHDAQQGVSIVRVFFEPIHKRTLQSRNCTAFIKPQIIALTFAALATTPKRLEQTIQIPRGPLCQRGREEINFLSFRLKGEILVPSEERDLKDSSHSPSLCSGLRFTGMTFTLSWYDHHISSFNGYVRFFSIDYLLVI